MTDLPLPIIGKELIIRRVGQGDFDSWYSLETDEAVKKYIGGSLKQKYTRQQFIDKAKTQLCQPLVGKKDDYSLALILKDKGNFAGHSLLSRNCGGEILDTQYELRVLIAPQYWGRNFGHEASQLLVSAAFKYLGVDSIVASVDPEHKAGRDLCLKLGFLRDGTKDNGHYIFRLSR
jgi:[ribosomal protein S5]-alanine N-acetyltransferase